MVALIDAMRLATLHANQHRQPRRRASLQPRSLSSALTLVLAGVAPPAEAQEGSTAVAEHPPEITIERHPEDWSYLSHPEARTGRWTEQFKYMPLSATGPGYVTTGLEARSRYEAFANPGWGSRPRDDYVWHRLMPYADLHTGGLRIFAQPIFSAISGTDRPRTPVDTTGADVLQAFTEVEVEAGGQSTLSLSAGRKVFSLGAGRFVDSRYGPNVLQPFDGLDFAWTSRERTLRMLYVRPVDTRPGHLNDRPSRKQVLWSLYATQLFGSDRNTGVDLFYIGFRDRNAVVDQGGGRQLIHTFGSRFFGEQRNWTWNIEGAVQLGSFGDQRVRAVGLGSEVGYRFSATPLQPTLELTIDYASGDRDPTDDKLQTINPLFPRGEYFVTQSPIGPRNLVHVQSTLTVHPHERLSLSLSGGGYWRASTRDGVYSMPGFLERSGRGSDARFVSRQSEIAATWQATTELGFSASLSVFHPQRFIRETGPAETTRVIVTAATFRF